MKSLRLASLVLSVAASWSLLPCLSSAADSPDLLQDQSKQKAALDDVSAAQKELIQLLGHGELFDDAKRPEVAPQAIPILRRVIADFDAMQAHVIRNAGSAEYKFQTLSLLALLGDEKTLAQLKENAKAADAAVAVEAGVSLALNDWWKSGNDVALQRKAIDSIKSLAHDHSDDDQLTITLVMMLNTKATPPSVRASIMKVVTDDLKGPLAQRFAESAKGEKILASLEGKPLVIAAKSLDGTDFSTAKWKGKVILVDFWASWCGPCKAELPRVKKAYADYHAKGFEVLGVSCDRGDGPLRQFLGENPDMPWPQLFDAANPGWHPLATGFGINSIPTMFLIDKNGVVRSVTARENFEELVPKMLEEK